MANSVIERQLGISSSNKGQANRCMTVHFNDDDNKPTHLQIYYGPNDAINAAVTLFDSEYNTIWTLTRNDVVHALSKNSATSGNISEFNGFYVKNGREITVNLTLKLTNSVNANSAIATALPGPTTANVPLSVIAVSSMGAYYGARVYGTNIYTNSSFPAGEYKIGGSYICN